jgi:sugar/nucleoside kinase (ribokinase family)
VTAATRLPAAQTVADSHLTPQIVELASGVDALYLSGRTILPGALLERLEHARRLAEATSCPVPLDLGDETFGLAPTAFAEGNRLRRLECGRR